MKPDHPHYETIEMMSDGQRSIIVHFITQAEWDAKCAEVERLTALVDELSEKVASLAAGCVNASREELVQRITAIGPVEWRNGVWLSKQLAPLRTEVERLTDDRDEWRRRYESAVQAQHDAARSLESVHRSLLVGPADTEGGGGDA